EESDIIYAERMAPLVDLKAEPRTADFVSMVKKEEPKQKDAIDEYQKKLAILEKMAQELGIQLDLSIYQPPETPVKQKKNEEGPKMTIGDEGFLNLLEQDSNETAIKEEKPEEKQEEAAQLPKEEIPEENNAKGTPEGIDFDDDGQKLLNRMKEVLGDENTTEQQYEESSDESQEEQKEDDAEVAEEETDEKPQENVIPFIKPEPKKDNEENLGTAETMVEESSLLDDEAEAFFNTGPSLTKGGESETNEEDNEVNWYGEKEPSEEKPRRKMGYLKYVAMVFVGVMVAFFSMFYPMKQTQKDDKKETATPTKSQKEPAEEEQEQTQESEILALYTSAVKVGKTAAANLNNKVKDIGKSIKQKLKEYSEENEVVFEDTGTEVIVKDGEDKEAGKIEEKQKLEPKEKTAKIESKPNLPDITQKDLKKITVNSALAKLQKELMGKYNGNEVLKLQKMLNIHFPGQIKEDGKMYITKYLPGSRSVQGQTLHYYMLFLNNQQIAEKKKNEEKTPQTSGETPSYDGGTNKIMKEIQVISSKLQGLNKLIDSYTEVIIPGQPNNIYEIPGGKRKELNSSLIQISQQLAAIQTEINNSDFHPNTEQYLTNSVKGMKTYYGNTLNRIIPKPEMLESKIETMDQEVVYLGLTIKEILDKGKYGSEELTQMETVSNKLIKMVTEYEAMVQELESLSLAAQEPKEISKKMDKLIEKTSKLSWIINEATIEMGIQINKSKKGKTGKTEKTPSGLKTAILDIKIKIWKAKEAKKRKIGYAGLTRDEFRKKLQKYKQAA
ncbi:hypothetical protein JXB01_00550, partial [Candidatus Micrarchaeota archaeon]|nr:hypothetical protein [Candidatus Micrarchaeota archaeon]